MDRRTDRLLWPDLLRALSCIGVVIIHLTSVCINNGPERSQSFELALILNSLVRWSVPVFFMLSGMFLLDPDKALPPEKLGTKILRLLLIISVWGVFYALLDDWTFGYISLISIPKAVLFVLAGTAGYHLWFLYTLLIIYLALPLLRLITAYASQKLLNWAILVWFIFGICAGWLGSIGDAFPQLAVFAPAYALDSLLVYTGYFLLGYVLVSRSFKGALVCMIAVLVTLLVGDRLCIFLLHCGPQVLAMPKGVLTCILSASIFLVAKGFDCSFPALKKAIGFMASHSLGIYLTHVFWITLLFRICSVNYDLWGTASTAVWLIVILGSSLGTTVLLRKLPYVQKIVTL